MNKEITKKNLIVEYKFDYKKSWEIAIAENIKLKEKLSKIKEWLINMDRRDVNATYNYEKLMMLANVNIGDSNE